MNRSKITSRSGNVIIMKAFIASEDDEDDAAFSLLTDFASSSSSSISSLYREMYQMIGRDESKQ